MLLLKWFCSHLLGDYLLQSNAMVRHKKRSGFLITAQSILRFSETKKESGRKEAEYILIGTLISFAFAILTGLLINQILK